MERAKGIEPSSQAWEARILPMNYARTIYSYYHIYTNLCSIFYYILYKVIGSMHYLFRLVLI